MKSFYTEKYFQQHDLLIPHLAQTIKKIMLENNLKKVLDVGCGTGRLVKFLNGNGFRAYGCDVSKEAVTIAKRINGTPKIFLAAATKLPAKNSSYDLICAISVIEHLTNSQAKKFLKEAGRVLKPTGFLFLVTPNYATPLRIIQGKKWFGYQDPTHVFFYTPKSLSLLLQKSGFKTPQYFFKIDWQQSLLWEFPGISASLPKFVKVLLVFLLFSSPVAFIRNSFWVSAQKSTTGHQYLVASPNESTKN